MTDAVVIGAGPNGLVAANLLADAGWNQAHSPSRRYRMCLPPVCTLLPFPVRAGSVSLWAEGNEEPCAFLYLHVDVRAFSNSYSVAAALEHSDDDSVTSRSEPVSPC